MATKVMACTCEHPGQDNIYGKGKRVFNEAEGKRQAEKKMYRCTVCHTVKG